MNKYAFLDQIGFDKTNLILIRGLPGSGKTTFAKELASTFGVKHYEADMFFEVDGVYKFNRDLLFRAHNWCQLNTEKVLASHSTVIVSNTFTTKKEIDQYIELANKYNALVTVVAVKGNFGSVHSVPEEALQRMRARWIDWPNEVIYVPENLSS